MISFEKRIFTIQSFWKAANEAFQAIFTLHRQQSKNKIDRQFSEKIMLCRYSGKWMPLLQLWTYSGGAKIRPGFRRNPGIAVRRFKQRAIGRADCPVIRPALRGERRTSRHRSLGKSGFHLWAG